MGVDGRPPGHNRGNPSELLRSRILALSAPLPKRAADGREACRPRRQRCPLSGKGQCGGSWLEILLRYVRDR